MSKNLEVSMLLDFYGDMLTDKQKCFSSYYYNDDLSLSEIGENEGISRQGVRDAIKRAESQLYEMEQRLGLLRRFRDVQKGLNKIIELTEKIENAEGHSDSFEIIYNSCNQIKETARKLSE